MNDYVTSLIRTWVPAGVGAVLAWLATHGAEVTADERAGLITGLTAAGTAAYYALVRGLETRWPWFGYLLGTKRPPTYESNLDIESNLDD